MGGGGEAAEVVGDITIFILFLYMLLLRFWFYVIKIHCIMGGKTVCKSIHMRHDHVMRQLLMMLRMWKRKKKEEEEEEENHSLMPLCLSDIILC